MVLVTFPDVDCQSTHAWCDNALAILAVLRACPEKVPFRIPPETLLQLEQLVTGWKAESADGRTPSARSYTVDELRHLVVYWFNITKLTPEERGRLGIEFTPPAGRAFADALAGAVGGAMASVPDLTELFERLEQAWRDCQPAFGA